MISKIKFLFFLAIIIAAFSFENSIETFNYAVQLQKKGKSDIAKNVYNKLLSNKDTNISFRSSFNLGCIYLGQHQYDSAMYFFKNAILLSPNNYESKYNYVYAKIKHQAIVDKNTKTSNSETNNTSNNNFEKNIASEQILNIIKAKEQETKNKYFNNLKIETPKSKNPW